MRLREALVPSRAVIVGASGEPVAGELVVRKRGFSVKGLRARGNVNLRPDGEKARIGIGSTSVEVSVHRARRSRSEFSHRKPSTYTIAYSGDGGEIGTILYSGKTRRASKVLRDVVPGLIATNGKFREVLTNAGAVVEIREPHLRVDPEELQKAKYGQYGKYDGVNTYWIQVSGTADAFPVTRREGDQSVMTGGEINVFYNVPVTTKISLPSGVSEYEGYVERWNNHTLAVPKVVFETLLKSLNLSL